MSIGFRSSILCVALALAACGAEPKGVEVRDTWSPPAPPGAQVLAVFATIEARGDDVLKSISSPVARKVEIHSSAEEDGMMKMRAVNELPLKGGETVQLAPGGLHIMLMDLDNARPTQGSIPITFHFAHAGALQVEAQIRPMK
jgi:copper(I)-binding protein